MILLLTSAGPLLAAMGLLLDVQAVFWVGVAVCGFNLFMNLASGAMNFPLLPGLMMLVGGGVLTPWYWGAALGLVSWTALEAVGDVVATLMRRR